MAEEKKRKIVTKVNTSEKVSADMDTSITDFHKLSLDKFEEGSLKIVVKKENNEIKKQELELEGGLAVSHKEIGQLVLDQAIKSLGTATDGEVKIVYKTELDFLN